MEDTGQLIGTILRNVRRLRTGSEEGMKERRMEGVKEGMREEEGRE